MCNSARANKPKKAQIGGSCADTNRGVAATCSKAVGADCASAHASSVVVDECSDDDADEKGEEERLLLRRDHGGRAAMDSALLRS